jgi:hypothetical protein
VINVKASPIFFPHMFSARRRFGLYIYFFFLYIRKENNNNNNRRRTPRKYVGENMGENMGETIWGKDFIFPLPRSLKNFERCRGVFFLPPPPY